jgi:hypothetical protein
MSLGKNSVNKFYLIYRKSDDRHGGIEDLYAWTTNKSTMNAFLKQRDRSKYIIDKVELDIVDDGSGCNHGVIDKRHIYLNSSLMIDILKLKSCQTGEVVKFFTTEEEAQRMEISINKMFDELRCFDRLDVASSDEYMHLVDLYNNLDDKYLDALNCIGYRPLEVSYMCNDNELDYYNLDIGVHSTTCDSESECELLHDKLKYDTWKIITYSLESAIKVLKNEL